MTAIRRVILLCDRCPDGKYDEGWLSVKTARVYARQREGWRRDKLGRDVCHRHPKLKGSR